MLRSCFKKHSLKFIKPAKTSRNKMFHKESWFIEIYNKKYNKKYIGECGLLKGLSVDDRDTYEYKLKEVCKQINEPFDKLYESLREWPSIQFGLEMAFKKLSMNNNQKIFNTDFTKGIKSIPCNGLIWISDKNEMLAQIEEKINQKYNCIKLKIGALDFNQELKCIEFLRNKAPKIEIRLDANGAFGVEEAIDKINQLSIYNIHSIEQPIKKGNIKKMKKLCEKSPIPIALDEELIGIFYKSEKAQLLDSIKPQYIILKPSFIGGFKGSLEWIEEAKKRNIGWWITSALESNIGLSAIAQFTSTFPITICQGLGTGGLYANNFSSSLHLINGNLWYKD